MYYLHDLNELKIVLQKQTKKQTNNRCRTWIDHKGVYAPTLE